MHGSLAMGCFQPWSSDIDLLAVFIEPMAREGQVGLKLEGVRWANEQCELQQWGRLIGSAIGEYTTGRPETYIGTEMRSFVHQAVHEIEREACKV